MKTNKFQTTSAVKPETENYFISNEVIKADPGL
jgi:hypothetical protein